MYVGGVDARLLTLPTSDWFSSSVSSPTINSSGYLSVVIFVCQKETPGQISRMKMFGWCPPLLFEICLLDPREREQTCDEKEAHKLHDKRGVGLVFGVFFCDGHAGSVKGRRKIPRFRTCHSCFRTAQPLTAQSTCGTSHRRTNEQGCDEIHGRGRRRGMISIRSLVLPSCRFSHFPNLGFPY